MTKAHVEKRKSFPFGHLWRSFLTDNSADCEPLWLPEPLEWLTSPVGTPLGTPCPTVGTPPLPVGEIPLPLLLPPYKLLPLLDQ